MEHVLADKILKSLQQNEDIYIHLKHLIDQAEEFDAKNSNYDVIKEYLLLSGNCQELLRLITEVSTWDSQNAMLLFNALSYILIRTAKDLDIYIPIGRSIANEILSYGMRTILNFLKCKQKSSRVKSALHLLTTMVALGGQIAHQVVAKLNFANTELFHLLGRTNFSEDEDVRTAFLNLIILILTVCNKNITRKMLEIKGFFNKILHGLLSDRASTIVLVLDTLREYVIEELYIPKTIKLNLFNDHSLKQATQLYLWKGPLKKNDPRKRKLGKKEYSIVAYEVSDEEVAEIRSCVHKFLLALLCSHKHGIMFSDPTCGVKGRNNNQVITNVLKVVPVPYCDPLVSDLVISVFQASPDQLKFYFPMFKDNFIPRISLPWLKAMDFLKKVIKSLNPVSVLFKTDIKRPIPVLVNIAKIFCLPDVVTPSDISEIFLNGHRIMCYHVCSFLLSILTQVKTIIDFCDHFEFSSFLYDPSEMSDFKKSFLQLMFPSLPAMDKIHHYWNRVTSEATEIIEDEFLKDLPIPKLFEELLPLIEVMKLYKIFSCKLNREYELDVPLLLNNLKKCSTVLSHSNQSKIYLSVIDIFSEQYNVTPWSKEKINNSPIVMILEVYLAAHRSGELVGARNILHKILLSTKIFDDCLWEIDLCLDAVECAKSQDIPVIFAVINEAIYYILYQPTKIIFEDEECIEKSNIKKTGDSSERETTCKEPPNEKKLFSKFVFAVLENLKFLEKSKRKGCQMFVEKVLDPLVHYQHSTKLLTALEPYKSVINPAIYDYWKFLFFYSSNIEICIDEVCTGNSCNSDVIDHLRQNFISYHSSAVEISSCDISNLIGFLNKNSVRKVIWQLLMYIDFEAKLILRNESQNSSMIILDIQFLEQILTFFPLFNNKPNCNSNEDIKIKQCNISTEEMDIVKDLLKHPILLKLFLFDMNTVENSAECIKNITDAITKFVLNIVKKISNFSSELLYSYLTPFKNKILKFLQKAKMDAFTEDIELSNIVDTFFLFFGFNDIQIILQTLLNVENSSFQNFEAYFPTLCLLIQIFIEKKEFVLLSSTSINALISAFASLHKKRKNTLGQYIYQLLLKHPIYAFLFTEDSMMLLLQHSSIKDLNILGVLIDYSNKFRQITQTFISDSLEEANTVKFLYLASKCLCSSEKENKSETEFKDLIFSRFFDTFKELVLSDLTNDLDILHNCTIGKSIQVLLQDKKENSKIIRSFYKSLMKNSEEVPSVSKMHAILQLFRSWILCSSDSNKTRLLILKVCFLWLSTGLCADFKNLELTNFIKEIIENMDCLEIDEVIDVTVFFRIALKFVLNIIHLRSDDIGRDILKILCLLCEKYKGNNLPVQFIHSLICGHSCFFKIMLTEEKEPNILKEHLIDLLIVLTKLDGSVCKENHLGFLLSAYGASMSNIDQKLLYLLKLYADNEIDMNEYSPFVWGKSAISHYSVMKASERFLWKRPSVQDVLSLFVPEKIETTVLYFPLTMKLEPFSELIELDSHLASKVYDMRFILPLFAHLLSPGTLVYCTQFIQSKVLMLIFISLSSLEAPVRALGFYCLALFYNHLEIAPFKEKIIWLCLLDFLRNAIESSNPKIPNIISLYLARVSDIFSKPDHQMYRFLYAFITRKPLLDIRQVPDFYNLFKGTHVEHRIHREWLLNLLSDGLRTSLDFHICEKRNVFNSLFIHYVSCLSTPQEKVAILRTLNSAVKIKSTACTLYEHALLTWVSNVIEESDLSDLEVLKNLCAVVESLEANIPDHFYFTTILWKLIPKVKFLDVCAIKSLISTLLKSLSVMKNSNNSDWSKYRISAANMNQLYEVWNSLIKKLETEKNALMEDEISFETSKINECLPIFAKISIFWEPMLNEDMPEELYEKQLNSLCSVLELIFQINSYSLFHFSDLPIWLHKCAKTDTKHGLVKVLLSSEGIKCLTSIIEIFEKSFNQEYKDEKSQQPKRNNWTEFLLYIKEISTKWHTSSKLLILQQIWNAI